MEEDNIRSNPSVSEPWPETRPHRMAMSIVKALRFSPAYSDLGRVVLLFALMAAVKELAQYKFTYTTRFVGAIVLSCVCHLGDSDS